MRNAGNRKPTSEKPAEALKPKKAETTQHLTPPQKSDPPNQKNIQKQTKPTKNQLKNLLRITLKSILTARVMEGKSLRTPRLSMIFIKI